MNWFSRQISTFIFAISLGAFATVLLSGSVADAQGQTCTEARLYEYQKGVEKFINDHPDHQAAVVHMIAEIESEYGGEVPLAKQCEVFAKVLKILSGGKKRPRPIKR